MKRLCHLISILFAAMITLCFTITAFADDKKYDIDFTREEAYAAVMNTKPLQAKNLYGGDASWYEALTDEDKEQLFEAMWNLTESGLLYEGTSTVHLSGFSDEYFSAVIDGFREAESNDEGLSNLRSLIEEINTYCEDNTAPDDSKVEIVEKAEPEETQLSKPDVTTAAITMEETQPPTTLYTTTTPIQAAKEKKRLLWIPLICVSVIAISGYIRYTKSKEPKVRK